MRKGRVEITTSTGEKAIFYDGIFKVSQTGGITTLTLTEQLAPCPSRKARAAAKKPKTRKLWGDGKGKFRTKGKYSAATVRGTRWLVQDGCTLTRRPYAVGSVSVRDDVQARRRHRAQGQVVHGQAAAVTQTSVGCKKRPTRVMVGPVRMRRTVQPYHSPCWRCSLAAAPAWADTWTVTDGSSDATTPACTATAHSVHESADRDHRRRSDHGSRATRSTSRRARSPARQRPRRSSPTSRSTARARATTSIDGGLQGRVLPRHRNRRCQAQPTSRSRNGAAGGGQIPYGGGIVEPGDHGARPRPRDQLERRWWRRPRAARRQSAMVLQPDRRQPDLGGGVLNVGGTELTPRTVTQIADSTIFGNTGAIGAAGGIVSTNQGLHHRPGASTVADNTGGVRAAVGGVQVQTAANSSGHRQHPGPQPHQPLARPSNCGGTLAGRRRPERRDAGHCGFTTGSQNRDAGLGAQLSTAGGETDVLPLAATSPAIDRVPAGDCGPAGTRDQRDVARPPGRGVRLGRLRVRSAAARADADRHAAAHRLAHADTHADRDSHTAEAGGGAQRRRRAGAGHGPDQAPEREDVREARPVGDPQRLGGRHPQGNRRDHALRRRQGDLLRRHLQALAVRRDHDADAQRKADRLPVEGQGRQRGGQEAQDAQALGRRKRQVPDERPIQRGDRPRYQVARAGRLSLHADEGRHRRRERARRRSRRRRSRCARARPTPRDRGDRPQMRWNGFLATTIVALLACRRPRGGRQHSWSTRRPTPRAPARRRAARSGRRSCRPGRTPEPDTIQIPAGNYQLSQGPLQITSEVTIAGAGADATTSSTRRAGLAGVPRSRNDRVDLAPDDGRRASRPRAAATSAATCGRSRAPSCSITCACPAARPPAAAASATATGR